jgi:drug/metabolite transporter (DMT)-like permease
MSEENLRKLKRRYAWGVFWSVLIAVTAVTILAIAAQTDFWIESVKPAPWIVRFSVAAVLIGAMVYIVSHLITLRSQAYKDAKREFESEGGKG